jgi:hypothetical protein
MIFLFKEYFLPRKLFEIVNKSQMKLMMMNYHVDLDMDHTSNTLIEQNLNLIVLFINYIKFIFTEIEIKDR